MIRIESDFIYFTTTEQTARKLDAVWVKSKNAYKVPNTLGALRELHKAGYDVAEYGKKKAEQRERILSVKHVIQDINFKDYGLRPYQNNDIFFLKQLKHAAIFNEQRTGKTPTTLKLLEAEGHDKIIIICPASLVLNWKKEVETWTSLKAFAVNGTKTKRLKTSKLDMHERLFDSFQRHRQSGLRPFNKPKRKLCSSSRRSPLS